MSTVRFAPLENYALVNEKCAVCQENVVEIKTAAAHKVNETCYHIFHTACLYPWLKEHKSCPTCRAEVDNTDYVKNITYLASFLLANAIATTFVRLIAAAAIGFNKESVIAAIANNAMAVVAAPLLSRSETNQWTFVVLTLVSLASGESLLSSAAFVTCLVALKIRNANTLYQRAEIATFASVAVSTVKALMEVASTLWAINLETLLSDLKDLIEIATNIIASIVLFCINVLAIGFNTLTFSVDILKLATVGALAIALGILIAQMAVRGGRFFAQIENNLA